mgnify:CR=1 FL=1
MSLKDTNAFKITSLPSITSPVAPDLRQFLNRLRETIEDPNGLVTKAELVNTGAFQNNNIGNLEYIEPGEEQSYIAPPAPLNLAASGAMTSIMLTWDGVNYNSGYAYTEVWRASVDNLGVAVLIGTTTSGMYADAVGSDASHYYWVRFRNVINDIGPFNAIAGVLGETAPDVPYLLSQLSNALTTSELHSDLTSRIDLIDGAVGLAGSVNARIDTEVTTLETADTAMASDITTLTTNVGTNASAITSEASTRATADTAIASDVTTLQTTVGGHTTSISTNVTSIDGINAKHTVKIDNNGYVTGYGLISTANNGTPTSEFMVVADQFSIAPVNTSNTATDGSPFFHRTSSTVINGATIPAGTYMKSAFIHDASITTAKIGNAAVDTLQVADAAITNAKINDLNASKITAGTINAARIAAGSITADKVTLNPQDVGAGTASGNNSMRITGTKIEIYNGGTLRVKLGDLS